MIQYKTVAGPIELTITRKESYADAVRQYAAIIDREAKGGWKLDCIQQVPVTKSAGCLVSLLNMIPIISIFFGQTDTTVYFNMLVFSKEE